MNMKEKGIEKKKEEEEKERTETTETTTKQDNKHEPEKLKLQEANSEQQQINSKGKGGGDTRVFKYDWLKVFPWAFVEGNHTFCRPCLLTGQKNVFTIGKPVSFRPKKDDFKKHESIGNHKEALQALANSSSLASSVGASSSPPSDISLVCLPSLPDTSTSSTTTTTPPPPPSSQTSSISPPISFLTPSSKTHNYLTPSTTLVSSSSLKAASGNTTRPRASSSSLVTPLIIPTDTPIPRAVSPSLQTSIHSSSVVSQSYIPSFAILKTPATQTLSQRHPHSTTFIVASSTGQQGPAAVGSSRVMATVAPLVASGMPRGGAPRKECVSGAGSRVNPPRTVIVLKPLLDPKRTQGSTLHKNKRAHAGCEQKDEKVEDRGSSAMEPQLNGKSVDPRLSCNICDKAFTAVQSMMRHKRAIHGVSSLSTRHRNVTCQECMQSFVSLSKLREHLFQVHGTEVKKVYHEFSSAREFMEWKNRLEADIGVNYTIQRGSRKTPYGSKLVYYCRRSGLERVSSQAAQENKRSPKSQGTCKMGHFCTSSIEVETIDETIHVTYFALFHHDHNLNLSDLVHMKLTKHDKDRIVGIITRGFSYKNILDRVRKTSERSRASLLGRKDIENVDVAYGLKQIQFQHPEDSEVDTCDSDKTTARQGQGEEYGMPCMDIVKVEIEEHEEAEEKIGVRGKNRDTVKDQAVVYPVTTTTTGAAGTNTLRLKKQRKTPLNNEQDHQQQQQPLLSSVAELCNRLLAAEKGDEFHQFGLNVAAQLRAMPLRASLKAQLEIQKTLTAKRFQSMKR